jgi:hypothetical protein
MVHAALGMAAFLALGSAAQARPADPLQVYTQVYGTNPGYTLDDRQVGYVAVAASGSTAFSAATAQADYGVLKGMISYSVVNHFGEADYGNAHAEASMADSMTIDSVALHDTQGTFDAKVSLHSILSTIGTLPVGADVAMNYSFQGYLGTEGLDGQYLSRDGKFHYENGDWQSDFSYDPNAVLEFTNVPFIYGKPIGISLGFLVAGTGSLSNPDTTEDASFTTTLDMGHTLKWEGLTVIRDSLGQEVFNSASGQTLADIGMSLSSVSGTDWSTPVPEPATLSLLMLGGLALLRRKRTT